MRKRNLLFVLAALLCATTLFAQKKVAFVYQSGYNASRYVWDASGYNPAVDPIHIALAATYNVTDFVYAQTEVPDTTTLATYDLVVMCEAMSGAQTLSNTMVRLVGKVPMLNMKAFVYTSGRWGWATPANPATKTTSVTINPGFETHEIFKDVVATDGVVQIFDGSTGTVNNMIQGFSTITSTALIEQDKIIANVTGTTSYAIHEIGNLAKKYMLIPISSDVLTTVTPNGVKLVMNACNYLMGGASGFDPDAPFKIAYLYDSSYSGYVGIANDPIFNNSVIAEKECEAIDIKSFTAASTDTLSALENYDLVVLSEAIGSGHAFAKPLLGLVNRVPILNFKSFFYKSSVWNWGAGVNPTTVSSGQSGAPLLKVTGNFADHALFANIELVDSTINMFKTSAGVLKNMMQGYTTLTGGFISSDNVLAKVTGTTATYNAVHEHGSTNKYMLIPISSDAMMLEGAINLSDNAFQMISNAVYYLIESRGNVLPATAPTFSLDYGNNVTHVTMSSLTSGATIYYTKDGTDPTKSSLVYSTIVDITDSCTIKAFAVKQGYDNSAVSSAVVIVKSMAAIPTISVTSATPGKSVTISAAEGATIYYTLNGGTPKETSTLYSGPFNVIRPCVVKAIAVQAGKLNSTVAEENVDIEGYVQRGLTLVWADFNTQPAIWSWATDTTPATSGDVISKYAYTIATEADPTLTPTLKTVNFNNGFMVGTYGQRINLQTTGVATTGNYSPETEGDAGATDRAMSFLTTNNSADPTTAYMLTTQAYPGPFDVTVWFTGAKGASYTEKLLVSVASAIDASTWTVLDTLYSKGDKLIRKRIAYYDATAPVFVKLSSATNLGTNSNMMIFNLKLMGEGVDPVAIEKPLADKKIVSTRIYTLSGVQVKTPVYGVNIIKNIYSDGSVETTKVIINERY